MLNGCIFMLCECEARQVKRWSRKGRLISGAHYTQLFVPSQLRQYFFNWKEKRHSTANWLCYWSLCQSSQGGATCGAAFPLSHGSIQSDSDLNKDHWERRPIPSACALPKPPAEGTELLKKVKDTGWWGVKGSAKGVFTLGNRPGMFMCEYELLRRLLHPPLQRRINPSVSWTVEL